MSIQSADDVLLAAQGPGLRSAFLGPASTLAPPPDGEIYPTLNAAVESIQEHARLEGYAVKKKNSSKSRRTGEINVVELMCNLGGHFESKVSEDNRQRKRQSKATGCLFHLVLRPTPSGGGSTWTSKIRCGNHNHASNMATTQRPHAGLPQEVVDLISSSKHVDPVDVAKMIKNHFGRDVLPRHVYNIKQQLRRSELGNLTPIQHLIQQLDASWNLQYEVDHLNRVRFCLVSDLRPCNQ